MKQAILFTTFLFTLTSSYTQANNPEAKAAYMLAEEAFAASDWKTTIAYLEECKKKLGKANSKVLYLQVITELELAKKDSAYYNAVLKSIAAFEKAPDIATFNEDKMLEVMKAKLRITRIKEQVEKDKLAKEEYRKWIKTLGGIVVAEKDGHGFVMAKEDIGKMNLEAAKKACEDLVLNGYDDWRLPTLAEFYQMIAVNPQQDDFLAMKGSYWANQVYEKKIIKQANAVRPVRSF